MATVAERIKAIEDECSGVWGQSGVTDWERRRLEEWKTWEHLSAKQEGILREIERKAFGRGDD